MFIGRTDAEAETPILWPPDAKSWVILEKTLMLGKNEGRRRSGSQRMRHLWQHYSMDISLRKFKKILKNRETCCIAILGSQRVAPHLGTEQQQWCWNLYRRMPSNLCGCFHNFSLSKYGMCIMSLFLRVKTQNRKMSNITDGKKKTTKNLCLLMKVNIDCDKSCCHNAFFIWYDCWEFYFISMISLPNF